jgi:hypothetical protein
VDKASPPRKQLLIALGISLLAAAIRLPGLALKPFWIAEVQEFAYAYRPGFLANPEFSAGDWVGYTYHSLCYLLSFEPSPLVVRAPALMLGSLLPGVIFLILSVKGHARAGFLGALFLVFSLPALQLSQEARLYASLSTFLAIGLLIQWLGDPRNRRTWLLLGLCDALALASHPYALFWLVVRWGAGWAGRRGWRRIFVPGNLVRYLPGPLLALGLQIFLVLSAASRFRSIHEHFTLQPYPPDFSFIPELLGHLGVGGGFPAALFGLLAVAGAYLLSIKDRAGAILLTCCAFLGPLLTLFAIWLARSRFGFVHLVPAAVPLYLLAAFGAIRLWEEAHNATFYRLIVGAVVITALLRMGWLDWRYHQRSTRLEMGADVAAACSALARGANAGDLVITTYDKYFTLFAWYCGPILSLDVTIAADSVPDSPFVRAFNHLAADGSRGPLPQERVRPLSQVALPASGSSIFLIVPYFEDIEGRYSESLEWYDMTAVYGPAVGPPSEALDRWQSTDFPLLKLLRLEVKPDMGIEELRHAVQRVQGAKRSWF